jgi:glycosyltransferase involved in cell wall biosynthesis
MLTGQSILCFAPGPWQDMWRSRHQIMSRLAQSNTVLWVEPRPALRRMRQALAGQVSWRPGPQHVRDGLHVFHSPIWLPSTGPRLLRTNADRLYRASLKRAMRRLGMDQPILWLYLPEMVAIIGQYAERLVVYHVVDEYSEYAGIPRSYLSYQRQCEEQMLRQASVVITTAPALYESKRRDSGKTFLVPNAVDYDGFQRTLSDRVPSVALAALPQPVIGYVGAMNDKLDYDLLLAVAKARPHWSLALVGTANVGAAQDAAAFAELRSLANVHVVGAVAVAEVPAYMAACQVCLLPYKINERTRNISSLKLYEYLACGKPIVSTNIPAAAEGQGLVAVATSDDFVSAISEALRDSPSAAESRRKIAAANTWEQRVQTISQIVERALADAKQRAMQPV